MILVPAFLHGGPLTPLHLIEKEMCPGEVPCVLIPSFSSLFPQDFILLIASTLSHLVKSPISLSPKSSPTEISMPGWLFRAFIYISFLVFLYMFLFGPEERKLGNHLWPPELPFPARTGAWWGGSVCWWRVGGISSRPADLCL